MYTVFQSNFNIRHFLSKLLIFSGRFIDLVLFVNEIDKYIHIIIHIIHQITKILSKVNRGMNIVKIDAIKTHIINPNMEYIRKLAKYSNLFVDVIKVH